MSDESQTPDSPAPASPPPPPSNAASVARGPYIAVAVLGVLAVVGYVDLKADLDELMANPVATAEGAAADAGPAALDPGAAPAPDPGNPNAAPPAQGQEMACAGTLTQEQVTAAVGQHGRSVFECYEARHQEAPELAGTLQMQLRVNSAGGVDLARFLGPMQDEGLLACIRERLRDWRFPPPAGGECAVVATPFSLGTPPAAPPPAP